MDLSSSMGLSSEDVEIDGKTREGASVEEEEVDMVLGSGSGSVSSSSSGSSSSSRNRRLMEFWPLQHPLEPPSEDQPVKCPITHHNYYYSSPPIITMPKEAAAEAEYYLRDSPPRTSNIDDDADIMKKNQKKLLDGGEIPHQTARPLRKRHHDHTIITHPNNSYN